MVTRLNQLSVIPEGERYNRTFFLFGAISVEMPPDFVYNGFTWGMIAACNAIFRWEKLRGNCGATFGGGNSKLKPNIRASTHYELCDGFWCMVGRFIQRIFMPLIQR